MKFLVDAQLPPRLVGWLVARGLEARHVIALPQGLATPDRRIWEMARDAGEVIIAKDSDFADRVLLLGPPPQVLQVAVGNCSNSELLDVFERLWEPIAASLRSGARLVRLGRTTLRVLD